MMIPTVATPWDPLINRETNRSARGPETGLGKPVGTHLRHIWVVGNYPEHTQTLRMGNIRSWAQGWPRDGFYSLP